MNELDLQPIELYIHIPFCIRKCNYCDFHSFVSSDETKVAYIRALCNEIEYKGMEYKNRKVTSIYIGGGTPSLIETRFIVEIMDTVRNTFTIEENAEITIECNPGTVTLEGLSVYKALGINRLSFGLQSSNDDELKLLGRIHDYKSYIMSLDFALRLDFTNISTDIMYGLPNQDIKTLRRTLSDVAKFNLKHISVYSLIIEENTPFFDAYHDDYITQCKGGVTSFLPDENALLEMTDFVNAYLNNRGYTQYEISNYSKKGYRCRHNIGYWKRQEYLGFGIGAASLINETRYKNISNIDRYIGNYSKKFPDSEYDEIETLTADESMAEFMLLGLRMTEGVRSSDFYNIYNRSITDVYNDEILSLISDGLLVNDGNIYKPTRKGLELQNIISERFI